MKRSYQFGENRIQGFTINVIRYVSPIQNGANSRNAGRYFGSIISPSGEEFSMGESGMSTEDIKRKIKTVSCGQTILPTIEYNRGSSAESAELTKLQKIRERLSQLGMNTDEVDARISRSEEELNRQRLAEQSRREQASEENRRKKARIKELDKMIKKHQKLVEQMDAFGISSEELNNQLSLLVQERDSLR